MQCDSTARAMFERIYRANRRDQYRAFHWHVEEQVSPHSISGKHVLEIGCGDAMLGLYVALSRKPQLCVAVDNWAGVGGPTARREGAAQLLHQFGADAFCVVQADSWALPSTRHAFDAILANNAPHHIAGFCRSDGTKEQVGKLTTVFRSLRELLEDDGVLVVQEFDGSTVWRFWPFRFRYRQLEWWLHPPMRTWLDAARLGGFKDVSYDYAVPWRARHVCLLLPRTVLGKAVTPGFYLRARNTACAATHRQ